MDYSNNVGKDGSVIEDAAFELGECDFYPPKDDRAFVSGVLDVPDGDTFHKYAECFWDEYGLEIYDEI